MHTFFTHPFCVFVPEFQHSNNEFEVFTLNGVFPWFLSCYEEISISVESSDDIFFSVKTMFLKVMGCAEIEIQTDFAVLQTFASTLK